MIKVYLTYSRMKDYLECPKRYKLKYIDKLKVSEDLYNACTGTLKQKIVELLYNEDWLFREKPDTIKNHFKQKTPSLYEDWVKDVEKGGNFVDLKSFNRSKEGLLEETIRGIDQIFNIIKTERLLVAPAQHNRSEVDGVFEGSNFTLKGRIDLVIGNRKDKPIIVDGKDTLIEKGENYNDPDQLYAYALMNNYQFGVFPDKLGFMMFRFNKVRWIDPKAGIKTFEEKAESVAKRIQGNDFKANVGESCRWCKYKSDCAEHKKWVSSQGVVEETL